MLLLCKCLMFSSPEQSSGLAFVILECPSSVVRRSSCVIRRSSCVVNNFVVTTLQPIILIESSSNLLRMLTLIISRTSSNMGGVGSKSRSLGQILVKSCYHSRGHNFDPIFIKLAQNAYIDNILDKFEYGWVGLKSRSLGQIFVKSC